MTIHPTREEFKALAKEYIVVPPVQSPKDTLEQGQVVRVIASIVVGAVVLREAWRHLMRNW